MSGPGDPSRRAILAWPLALAAGPCFAQDVESDRGIGGTGVVPQETGDRGAGGTGVIGTIQRFGSIYVNDLRIAYPRSVAVLIDDKKALVTDLRLGHVVSVLAESRSGALATRRIDVSSEVVGPIEAVSPHTLVVLGQTVLVPSARAARRRQRWRIGDRVAVHGLRRLDGAIVANFIEARGPGLMRVSGPARIETDGVTMIGSLPVRDETQQWAGRRVSLTGHMVGGVFQVVQGRSSIDPLLALQPSRFSLEGYVAPTDGALRLGSGVTVQGGLPLMPDSPDMRAIVTANVASDGNLQLDSVHYEGGRSLGGRGRSGGVAPTAPSGTAPAAAPGSSDPGTPAGVAPRGSVAPGQRSGALRGDVGTRGGGSALGARGHDGHRGMR